MKLADVVLDSPCGSRGICGRCRVVVTKGAVEAAPVPILKPEEMAEGIYLACQTRVRGDLEVTVPESSQQVTRKRAIRETAAEKVSLPVIHEWVVNPVAQKFFIALDKPSLADNTNDFDRLARSLAKEYGLKPLSSNLAVLRSLARTLRAADWRVTAVVEPRPGRYNLLAVEGGDTTAALYGVAVDIWTTTVAVYLVDLTSGKAVATDTAFNAQMSYGEDIISRIIYSQKGDGLRQLNQLVVKTINELITGLARGAGIDPAQIYAMVAAGNTTMVHLFLGLNPKYIREEPYLPTTNHPPIVSAEMLGLGIYPNAPVYVLPGVGSYVGADIVSGVLASGVFKTDKLTLYLDIGTNGEIVLGTGDWLITCACSAGPAFEGAGVRHGMRAAEGAIEKVLIDPVTFETTIEVIGGGAPQGLCGSGLIYALAEMFVRGVIDKAGRIQTNLLTARVRQGEQGPEFVIAWAKDRPGQEKDIVITELDIDNLIRTKGAIYAGYSVLANSVGVNLADVEEILIAGAFGKHINVEKGIEIGLLPDLPWERFKFLGNCSALGAYTVLLSRDSFRLADEIAAKMTYLELSADNRFMDKYTSALFLPHTDLGAFPSVAEKLEARSAGR